MKWRWPLAALATFALLAAVEVLWLKAGAARIPLLESNAVARWLVAEEAVDLGIQNYGKRRSGFQLHLQLTQVPTVMPVELASTRSARLFVNGDEVAATKASQQPIAEVDADLAPHLKPGANTILIVASNDRGPPAVRLKAAVAGVATGAHWLATQEGGAWRAARDASSPRLSALSGEFVTPLQGLRGGAWMSFTWAALGLLAYWVLRGRSAAQLLAPARWGLVLGIGLLFLHNFGRIPNNIGMDLDAHFEYVEYILNRGALPLANEGWQMFQPPLAYLIAAALAGAAKAAGWGASLADLTRGLTMLVSLGTLWLGCRFIERVFAARPDAALAGMVVAASLPAVIYMGHSFGNEPYLAFAGVLLLKLVAEKPQGALPWRRAAVLGLVGGLALLAKTSAIILVAALAPVVWWQGLGSARDRVSALRALAVYSLGIFIVAGGWYLRNQWELGRPFVGGWESGRGIDWWQYPGYRVWEHLTGFGVALTRPVFAGAVGFWDGIYASLWGDSYLGSAIYRSYAPNWNYNIMNGLVLLALPLTVAIGSGSLRAWAPAGPGVRADLLALSSALLVLYLGAAFHLYARIPIYSAAKASYLLVLAPCMGALAAWGLEPLLRSRAGRIAVVILLSVWLGNAWMAFVAQAAP